MNLIARFRQWLRDRRDRKKAERRERMERRWREMWGIRLAMSDPGWVDAYMTSHPICRVGHEPEILDGVPRCLICGTWVLGAFGLRSTPQGEGADDG